MKNGLNMNLIISSSVKSKILRNLWKIKSKIYTKITANKAIKSSFRNIRTNFDYRHSSDFHYKASENEISRTEFVNRDNILDFLEAEVNSGESEITPWFNMILQTKLFGWWDHLIQTGELPSEDASGHITNYIRGPDAINPEAIPSIIDVKEKFQTTN